MLAFKPIIMMKACLRNGGKLSIRLMYVIHRYTPLALHPCERIMMVMMCMLQCHISIFYRLRVQSYTFTLIRANI